MAKIERKRFSDSCEAPSWMGERGQYNGAEILVSGVVGRTWLGNLVKGVSDVRKEIEKD
jgi:hypothetical protein